MGKPNIRISKTGASRDSIEHKFSYRGFNHPLVENVFARYMDKHRVQSNGELRDSDNWWLGFDSPKDTLDSLIRHVKDLELLMAGYDVIDERGNKVTFDEAVCGARFNINALILDHYKDVKEVKRGA